MLQSGEGSRHEPIDGTSVVVVDALVHGVQGVRELVIVVEPPEGRARHDKKLRARAARLVQIPDRFGGVTRVMTEVGSASSPLKMHASAVRKADELVVPSADDRDAGAYRHRRDNGIVNGADERVVAQIVARW